MSNTIDNFDNVIDSRDVIARIEELEGEREALLDNLGEAESALEVATDHEGACDEAYKYHDSDDTRSTPEWTDWRQAIKDLESAQQAHDEAAEALEGWDASSDADELRILKALADEASGYAADWQHGETLIRDSYFKEYAQELAEDIGAIDNNASWPLTCIDWVQATRELRMDYSAVDFDGVTYWIR